MHKTHSLFWDVYAGTYDNLLDAIPYQRLVNRIVASVPGGVRSVFDAGCGTGNTLQAIQRRYPNLHLEGMDCSPAMLKRAKAKLGAVTLTQGDLNRPLPHPDGTFDVVICINVLYALADIHQTLRELRRILKRGGTLIATSPLGRPRIQPLIAEHASAAGWMRSVPLFLRMSFLLLLNLCIVHSRAAKKFHFLEMGSLRELFNDAPISLVYGRQNWFVCIAK